MSETCEKVFTILEKTNDGNLLSPDELFLVETAVNGYLTEKGENVFNTLYKCVIEETFIPFNKRWFRGVENITADTKNAGGGLWILWKGNKIEHYDSHYAYSEEALKELYELKRRCEILESQRKEISVNTIIWSWNN